MAGETQKRPLLIAHRGFPAQAIENTRESFQKALDLGADVLETDARLCADGHLVLSHDPDFRRFGGPSRPVSQCTRGQIESYRLHDESGHSSSPLFLDDALELFPNALFNIDLKDPGSRIVDAWIRLLDRSDSSRRCTTASFRNRTLALYRRLRPGAPVSIARMSVLKHLVAAGIGRPLPPGPGELVMHLPEQAGWLRLISPERINFWHNAGWQIHVWTIDDADDMRRLANWGVDGIITNRADIFREVFA